MKKYLIILISAFMALSCFSCQDKNTDGTPENSDIQEEVQDDDTHREYTDSDFKDISIITTRSQDKLRANNYEKTVDLNLGKRVSPCKADEFYEKFIPYYYINPQYQQTNEEYIKDIREAESAGRADWFCINGNIMYFVVSHDDFCSYYSHDISVYSYNFDTEITDELYNYSGTDYGMSIERLEYSDGLFFVTTKGYTKDLILTQHGYEYGPNNSRTETALCRLDEKKKDIVTIQEEPYLDYYFSDSENGFIIKNVEFSGTDNKDETYTLSEYNSETKKTTEIFKGELNQIPVPCGNSFVTYYKDDSKNITVNAENYTLSTELKGNVTYASEKSLIISHSDDLSSYSKTRIYIYNFKTMERYVIDLSDYGSSVYPCGENLIISGDNMNYYLIPENGMTFFLGTQNDIPKIDKESGRTYITNIASDEGYSSYMDDEGKLKLAKTMGGTSGTILFIE